MKTKCIPILGLLAILIIPSAFAFDCTYNNASNVYSCEDNITANCGNVNISTSCEPWIIIKDIYKLEWEDCKSNPPGCTTNTADCDDDELRSTDIYQEVVKERNVCRDDLEEAEDKQDDRDCVDPRDCISQQAYNDVKNRGNYNYLIGAILVMLALKFIGVPDFLQKTPAHQSKSEREFARR